MNEFESREVYMMVRHRASIRMAVAIAALLCPTIGMANKSEAQNLRLCRCVRMEMRPPLAGYYRTSPEDVTLVSIPEEVGCSDFRRIWAGSAQAGEDWDCADGFLATDAPANRPVLISPERIDRAGTRVWSRGGNLRGCLEEEEPTELCLFDGENEATARVSTEPTVEPEPDLDGDGTPDSADGCVQDVSKTDPGVCGCGIQDTDSDGDGVADCFDLCPYDSNKFDPTACGCNVADTDDNGDGIPDCWWWLTAQKVL